MGARAARSLNILRWVSLGLPLVVGFTISAAVMTHANRAWYEQLEKPEHAMPPQWVFALAWGVSYFVIGVCFYVLMTHCAVGTPCYVAITLMVAQLLLNFAWMPTFFAGRRPQGGAALIVAMLVVSVANVYTLACVEPLAGVLLIPYIGWLSYALYLNWDIASKEMLP